MANDYYININISDYSLDWTSPNLSLVDQAVVLLLRPL